TKKLYNQTMTKTLYLEYDEEVLSVLQKIRNSAEAEVVLVVPKDARLFRNLTGLRLLKQEAEKYQKILSIATADERGRMLVKRAGIPVLSAVSQSAAQPLEQSASLRLRRGASGMGDVLVRPVKPLPKVSTKSSEAQTSAPVEPVQSSVSELAELIGPKEESPKIKLPEPVKIPHLPFRYTVLPALIFLAVLFVLAVFILPKATVKVVPRTEPITRDLEMQVDASAGVPDVQNLTIPGKRLTQEVAQSGIYPTTGVKNVGEKASGFVTLYNFSKNSLILKSATTRLEVNGKSYRFLQDVGSIRPTARIGTDLEIDKSSLIDPVPVVAEGAGGDYNLPAGAHFEIYNEVFGHQPDVLYAVNANPIAGGTNKEVKIVSAADIESARADLKSKIGEQVRKSLSATASADVKLLDNAFTVSVKEEKVSRQVNEEAESFELSQKAEVTALAFSEPDVRDLIVERIVRLLPENK
ncbi:MAG: hypothetical protein M1275_01830, partial [Patescibacteria group bacterium]|nr:hypothetical protein [Patescibacteria group bacterium]